MNTEYSTLFNPEYDGSSFTLPGTSACILLFHGFTATTLEVRGLGEYLHTNLGCTVNAPLLPGHGTTPADLAQTSFKEWIARAESAYADLGQKCDQILVGGESMGGLLSLYLAAQHSSILGLLIFAPALIVPGMQKARLLHPFISNSPKKLNPTLPGFLPWQGYRVNPLKAVVELGKLQNLVKAQLKSIQQPTLIFQGLQDETIDIRSCKLIVDSISSKRKDLVEVDNCSHCVLLDIQHEQIYQRTASFIQSLLIR